MKRVLSLTALLATTALLAAPAARAQRLGVSINPYLGYYAFDESSFEDAFDNADLDAGAIWGVRLGLGGHDGLSLDLAYGRSSVDGEFDFEDDVLREDADIDLFYGALNYHLPLPVDVFLSGGLGGIRYAPEERDSDTNLLVNYGAGVSIPLGAWRIRADAKDHVDLCDAPEDLGDLDFGACLEDEALHNIELSAGLEFGF
ncbi:MAG TPA: outer membrane beta-barrel protein [Gemmatimonadota bacterium]|nr:outer membrane beta-barrel protein [Gemmatimonadota bacterium]